MGHAPGEHALILRPCLHSSEMKLAEGKFQGCGRRKYCLEKTLQTSAWSLEFCSLSLIESPFSSCLTTYPPPTHILGPKNGNNSSQGGLLSMSIVLVASLQACLRA